MGGKSTNFATARFVQHLVNFEHMNYSLFKSLAAAFCLVVAALTLPTGCSTDVDVVAEYEDIAIVYGLLDANDSAHYVRVSKAFLGQDDAVVMAAVRDSSEYKDLNVRIEELDESSNVLRSWQLTPVELTRAESIFAETQTYFTFGANDLSPDYIYKLVATLHPDKPNQKIVTAETPLIGNMTITRPPPTFQVRLVNVNELSSQAFKWSGVPNALQYDVTIEVPVLENRNGVVTETVISWQTASLRSSATSSSSDLEFSLDGEEFFNQLKRSLEVDPDVQRKIPENEITVWITAGGEELATYAEVANPTSGLVQDKPEYTNVDGGLGVFSCRTRQPFVRTLDKSTMDELVDGLAGGGTAELGFCNDNLPASDPDACLW